MVKTPVGRVRWHFLSRGYQEVQRERSSRELIFKEGLHLTLVKVVTREELRDRNALLKAIVNLNPREAKVNRAYLALPKRYVAALDASILRDRGIGVIAYDDESVHEVLPANLFERELETPRLEEAEMMRYDIDELRRLYTELRKEVSDLIEELAVLRRELKGLRAERATIVTREQELRPSSEEASKVQDRGLPSFFSNNPWLDVLSRRGKEDGAGGRTDE
ncbi:MAG: hypothetical protein QXF26_05305 [Candidatus Bathyarchaeia archaeon]